MEIVIEQPAVRTTLLSCLVCCARLPLRLPRANEEGQEWTCSGCGSQYVGVFDDGSPAEIQGNAQSVALVTAEQAARRKEHLAARRGDYQSQGTAKTAPPPRTGIRCPLQTVLSKSLDREAELAASEGLRPQGEAFAAKLQKHAAGPYSEELVHNLIESLDASSTQVGEMFSALKLGRPTDMAQAETIVRDGLEQAIADIDLFVGLGIQPPGDNYPSRHSVHVGMLAMSIGAMLNWDLETLTHLGIGCLVHDVGMLRIGGNNQGKPRILAPADFAEIATHPIHTLDLLEKHLDRIPREARLVAYQLHERPDGSGYPRGASGRQVHELARVAAVADTFIALSTPRPHRPALLPYHAVETILQGAKLGIYDSNVVRGLLKAVSLFPIGSRVSLSDGRTAQVLRSNGDQYTRPVVEVFSGSSLGSTTIIDLSQDPELKIVGAVPSATAP